MKKNIGNNWHRLAYKLTAKNTNVITYIVGASKEQIVMLKSIYNPETFKWRMVKIQEVK